MPTVSQILDALFTRAPRELAHEGDNIGLQVGDPAASVTRVVTALDATRQVILRAKAAGAQMIVAHHPLLFVPLKSFNLSASIPSLLAEALRADVAIAGMHTNLDFAPGGVNERLAQVAGLRKIRPLRSVGQGSFVKVAVFVPEVDHANLRQVMCQAGAGAFGNYTECSFRTAGTGTFRPEAGANPAIGELGKLAEVPEERLEVLVPKVQLARVLQAMLDAHPYEEVAYDVYPLGNTFPGAGDGMVGELEFPQSVTTFTDTVARTLRASSVRITGDPKRSIQKVAVLGGSARGYVELAHRAGAYALLAGEIPHHERLEADDMELAVIELGHGPSELPAVWVLADWITQAFGDSIDVIKDEGAASHMEGAG